MPSDSPVLSPSTLAAGPQHWPWPEERAQQANVLAQLFEHVRQNPGKLPMLARFVLDQGNKSAQAITFLVWTMNEQPFNIEVHAAISSQWKALRKEVEQAFPVNRWKEGSGLSEILQAWWPYGLHTGPWRAVFEQWARQADRTEVKNALQQEGCPGPLAKTFGDHWPGEPSERRRVLLAGLESWDDELLSWVLQQHPEHLPDLMQDPDVVFSLLAFRGPGFLEENILQGFRERDKQRFQAGWKALALALQPLYERYYNEHSFQVDSLAQCLAPNDRFLWNDDEHPAHELVEELGQKDWWSSVFAAMPNLITRMEIQHDPESWSQLFRWLSLTPQTVRNLLEGPIQGDIAAPYLQVRHFQGEAPESMLRLALSHEEPALEARIFRMLCNNEDYKLLESPSGQALMARISQQHFDLFLQQMANVQSSSRRQRWLEGMPAKVPQKILASGPALLRQDALRVLGRPASGPVRGEEGSQRY